MPPLVTRPKAATVGVGRQVILRPAVQKRYLELDGADARTTSAPTSSAARRPRRPRAARRDRRAAPAAAASCAQPDWQVTAVIVDDLLIDVEPGDTTERCHAIAFDLGTTTVVATLLDLGTGTPVAVRSMLNRQQPFGADVISRISATMLDPTRSSACAASRATTLHELAQEVCEAGGRRPAEVYEVALAGNATMTELALGIDPEPVGVAPFIMAARVVPGHAGVRPRRARCTRAPARRSSPRSARTSAATSSPVCSRRA